MAGLSQEEKLFLEIARKSGAISQAQAQIARVKAQTESASVAETLTSMGALSIEAADTVRRELLKLSFTCPRCLARAYRTLDDQGRARSETLCAACAESTRAHPGDADATAAPLDPQHTVGQGNDTAPPAPPLQPGEVIGGCAIEEALGAGGMSTVYRAHHVALNQQVAVKVLDQRLVARRGFIEQFLTEARTLARLDHPNIVRFFEAARDDASGVYYMVMELLSGGSVQTAWERARRKLPVHEAVRIVTEAATGLAHAHAQGLVHRDVKPANLMFDKQGNVKVVDFGVAIPAQRQVFVATEIVGTLHYLAPEQIDGLVLDTRCDQYALGVSLFQLLCGKLPFERERSVDVLFAHVNEAPPAPRSLRPEIPEWLERVITKLLAKAPADRFASLDELAAVLAKGERAPVKPAGTTRMARSIQLEELSDLDTARRPALARPSARPALLVALASLAASLVFLVGPARSAVFSRAEARTSEPSVVASDAAKAVAPIVKEGDGQKLAAAVGRLDAEIEDLHGGPGLERLKAIRFELLAALEVVRKKTRDELAAKVDALLAKKRYGAALDVDADRNAELATIGIDGFVKDLRSKVRAALAADRGEIYVPGGSFFERPRGTRATLPPFYLDRTEVTNGAWARAVEAGAVKAPPGWAGGKLDPALAERPVTGISFEEARAYARATGKRLPTSREWEKAARGEDARSWPWGESFEPGRANLFDGGSGGLEDVTAREGDASPWGALGLAGNALEWVESDAGPRVAGGGYLSQSASARVFERLVLPAESRHAALGFRCARDLEKD